MNNNNNNNNRSAAAAAPFSRSFMLSIVLPFVSQSGTMPRYAGGVIEWTKQELKELDHRTRKLLTMSGGLHPADCVVRLYVPRKHGGRGLISVEDCINQARLLKKTC